MAPKIGYMHLNIIKYYYDQLTSNSWEADVDNLWNNILPRYFTGEKNYGIEQQQRPWPGSGNKQRTDFTIRYIKNGQPKKVVLIEDKRVSDESSDVIWMQAVEQVTSYMKVVRADPLQSSDETMYAIVTVGHYSRFYLLLPHESSMHDYPGTGGEVFEFKKDEEAIDTLLLELVERTQ